MDMDVCKFSQNFFCFMIFFPMFLQNHIKLSNDTFLLVSYLTLLYIIKFLSSGEDLYKWILVVSLMVVFSSVLLKTLATAAASFYFKIRKLSLKNVLLQFLCAISPLFPISKCMNPELQFFQRNALSLKCSILCIFSSFSLFTFFFKQLV